MEPLYLTPLTVLADGYSAASIWIELDSGARLWPGTFQYLSEQGRAHILDEAIERHRDCAARLGDFPIERWIALGNAVGWTSTAITAMSWCAQATLPQVLQYWCAWQQPLASEPGADFSARLINPAFLPENRLSALAQAAGNPDALALLLAARVEPPINDVSAEAFNSLPPLLIEMIKTRSSETKPSHASSNP